jgi:Trypsin
MRILLAVAVALVAAAPASGVVGGKPLAARKVPWFASFAGCGGTLVAPDRILTAGHCVAHRSLEDFQHIAVGGAVRRGVRVAMHPNWRAQNGRNRLDDVALIQLDQPVTGVKPVTLGGAVPARVRVLGRGLSTAPRRGAPGGIGGGGLREAVLRSLSDRACARNYRGHRGNGSERLDAARMLCAIDADGRKPLSSACVGDSGGPLYAGSRRAPHLLGVVSWGGDRCGADHLASVFADVRRYATFIAGEAPVWAPVADGPASISGDARPGGALTCSVAAWSVQPETVEVLWQRLAGGRVTTVGHAASYTVVAADGGHVLACGIEASNAGGIASAPTGAGSAVHVPR